MNGLSPEERFAIEDLFSTNYWALDTADAEGFADTFVEDCRVLMDVMNRKTLYKGRGGMVDLAESLRVWDRFPGCQHYAGQPLIEGKGDRCRARSYLFVAECRGEPPYAIRLAGRSDDHLVRRQGRWLFARRWVRMWQGDALRNIPMEMS